MILVTAITVMVLLNRDIREKRLPIVDRATQDLRDYKTANTRFVPTLTLTGQTA